MKGSVTSYLPFLFILIAVGVVSVVQLQQSAQEDARQKWCEKNNFSDYWELSMNSEKNQKFYRENSSWYNMTMRNEYYYKCLPQREEGSFDRVRIPG